jgi:hypothetical protein
MRVGEAPSVVVFTRGRPGFVHRLTRYYAEYPGRLIVVDGSADAVASRRGSRESPPLHARWPPTMTIRFTAD